MNWMQSVFGEKKAIIGMLHLRGWGHAETLDNARREIDMMYENGVSAVLVENYFGDAEDVENALQLLSRSYSSQVYGVNMLGFPEMGFRMAREYGARFVQMDSVCGHLTPRQEEHFLRELSILRGDGDVYLLGGVRFKYQPYRSGRSLEEDLTLAKDRCDAVVVTGAGTGISTEMEKICRFRQILGQFPLVVGAGMTARTAREQLSYADGAIVGSYFKEGGNADNPMDPARVKAFMNAVNP